MTPHRTGPQRALHELLGASQALFKNRQFARRGRVQWSRMRRGFYRAFRHRWVRRTAWSLGIGCGIIGLLLCGLWWRLASGPIELDLATPWLRAAIEENFGNKHTVTVGGTQLERDHGRTALRIRDIVVRDASGAIVASAPKAEVGLSGASLLTGRVRAESLNLVGAELSVRIEADGKLTVFAGATSAPIATAPISGRSLRIAREGIADPVRNNLEDLSALLTWIDELGATGIVGYDLREIGLKSGSLTVEDRRNGKNWMFREIDVTMRRPKLGGVILRLASEDRARPWEITAALRPLSGGVRAVGIEARKVSANDLLLAMRMDIAGFEADVPLSASMRAEFDATGFLQAAGGQLIAEPGVLRSTQNAGSATTISRADVRFNWDGRRQTLLVPFQIVAGGNQFTITAQVEPIPDQPGVWALTATRGDPVIDPIILTSMAAAGEEVFALNRVVLRARIDTTAGRFVLDQGDFARNDIRADYNIGVALSGSFDYGGSDLRLALGVAGTRMPVWIMKRLWPGIVGPHVRDWVDRHISAGTVERVVLALNAPLSVLAHKDAQIPDEGLSVDIETSGTVLQPIPTLPPIRDADLTVRASGRTATVALGRGTIELAPGRRLSIASGIFDVPDTHSKSAPATARFRIDGSVSAAALLLAREPLRSATGIVLDPATSRGTLTAQVALEFKLDRDRAGRAENYSVVVDLTNFAAERILLGQRMEASVLRVSANAGGYQVKGDAKINGTPATLDFRKADDASDADLHLQATLDEPARRRLGIDFGSTVVGSIPVKVSGKFGADGANDRLNVEADFTPAKIDSLLPGWTKAAGKSARATFVFSKDAKSTRFDELTIDGQGVVAKGSVELDKGGDIVSANFPVFGLSEGDRVSLKADRLDSVLHVVMRGDVYDARNVAKATLANLPANKTKAREIDIDLDIRLGAVVGHNGEALRGLELKLLRRAGRIRSFGLNAKIGRDTPLAGDLRQRPRDGHPVLYLETNDAGALFRFTDTYPRMTGGQMWLSMEPPTPDQAPQVGILAIRNFTIRDEPGLARVLSNAPGQTRGSVDFSELRADFTRMPGRMVIREGVVRGPVVGATIDGQIDYVRDEIRMRGTFVPFYAINNMFGQIPIVGIFLGGGSNEGLLGLNYEASGPPNAPRISVNPISAVAPGLLRKLMPGPGMTDPNFVQPTR